jgi:hypothetical protein
VVVVVAVAVAVVGEDILSAGFGGLAIFLWEGWPERCCVVLCVDFHQALLTMYIESIPERAVRTIRREKASILRCNDCFGPGPCPQTPILPPGTWPFFSRPRWVSSVMLLS